MSFSHFIKHLMQEEFSFPDMHLNRSGNTKAKRIMLHPCLGENDLYSVIRIPRSIIRNYFHTICHCEVCIRFIALNCHKRNCYISGSLNKLPSVNTRQMIIWFYNHAIRCKNFTYSVTIMGTSFALGNRNIELLYQNNEISIYYFLNTFVHICLINDKMDFC